ncbi:hypothetical protein FVE85_7998 [Porphyridium purpureum]|uniref:COX assembly mitochondrial protein n=1 Tax=Porphyridium purpureum TaxID=35688 RepID=A0A5J4YLX5_PORPP|nr:hypothetical protein FVE85_7998 [Porphyridium purpureum]|eukprot:POR2860..scf295_9
MGKRPQGAGLPKRKVIERMVARQSECTPALISMLDCFRQHNFSEAKCSRQMALLSECVKRQEKTSKTRSTLMYHLIRLQNLMR